MWAFLPRITAKVVPIMKKYDIDLISLEEFEVNKEFVGWYFPLVISLELKSLSDQSYRSCLIQVPSDRWYIPERLNKIGSKVHHHLQVNYSMYYVHITTSSSWQVYIACWSCWDSWICREFVISGFHSKSASHPLPPCFASSFASDDQSCVLIAVSLS